jgi:hypothetical protein
MRHRLASACGSLALISLCTVFSSCASSETPASGTGGSPGTGGSATGGSTGTGGSSATGGSTGTGGSAATGGAGGQSAVCTMLMNYVATTSTAPSFARDIYPIISNTDPGTATSPAPGCGQTMICHGSPAGAINKAATAFLSFVDPAATVKTALLASSVGAPTMKRVDPGHVGSSFMAYKLYGLAALACVSSSCPPGTTVGNSKPCGDPMPNVNGNGVAVLTDADRTKILDWIALGAHD